MNPEFKRLPTIAELEAILADDSEQDLEIQPDGSIKAVPKGTAERTEFKPITMHYAAAEYF